jgi:hypothetical protein
LRLGAPPEHFPDIKLRDAAPTQKDRGLPAGMTAERSSMEEGETGNRKELETSRATNPTYVWTYVTS